MRNCYISRNYKTTKSGGGRLRTDHEQIMDDMGFVNLGLKQSRHSNKVYDFFYTFTSVMKAVASIRKGDVLLLQYPMKKYYEFVCDMAHHRGAHVVTFIHDLGCFRRKKLTVEREMRRLAHSDALIVHNQTMYDWLHERGYKGAMQIIGFYDYLSPEPIESARPMPQSPHDYSLFFAGSLSTKHNAFIYQLPEHLQQHKFHLYGSDFRADLAKDNLVNEGFAADYDLMACNHGDFGLSWYGESLTEGKGMNGEYMAYNNPHKVFLYLRCHVPVIISKHAGLASAVQEAGIGICVDSLEQIGVQLEQITLEDYCRMLENVKKVSDRSASGYYLRKAYTEIVKEVVKEE